MARYARAGGHCPPTPPLRSADVRTTIPLILLHGSRAEYIMALTNPDKIDRMAEEQKRCFGYVTDAGHRFMIREQLLVRQQPILAKLESLSGMVGTDNSVDKERDEFKQLPDGIQAGKGNGLPSRPASRPPMEEPGIESPASACNSSDSPTLIMFDKWSITF